MVHHLPASKLASNCVQKAWAAGRGAGRTLGARMNARGLPPLEGNAHPFPHLAGSGLRCRGSLSWKLRRFLNLLSGRSIHV